MGSHRRKATALANAASESRRIARDWPSPDNCCRGVFRYAYVTEGLRCLVAYVEPVPGWADQNLVDAGVRRQFADEADGAAQIFRLQHFCHVCRAGRDRAAFEDW